MKKSLANSTTTFLWNKCIGTKSTSTSHLLCTTPQIIPPERIKATPRLPFTTTTIASPSPPRTGNTPTPHQHLPPSPTTRSTTTSSRGGIILQGHSSLLHLPPPDPPVGLGLYRKSIYCPHTHTLRTSGHVGTQNDNSKADGIVGDTLTPEEARIHARNAGLRLLATVYDALGGDEAGMGRVEQVLHLRGMVKAAPGFEGFGGVIDGCSEVLVEAFGGEVGVGTRECFGVGGLGASVFCTLVLRVGPLVE